MTNRIFNQFLGFIKTPSLFLSRDILDLSLFHKSLEILNISIDTIENIHFSENTVLGKRVEHFFKTLVTANENFKLLANNIQIHNKDRTLGELDFIVKDLRENHIFHVELMYKFYVYDPEISIEMERWIGPNRKDSLLQKIEKVKSKQFPLINSPEAKKFLNTMNISAETIQQEICFKASLFIPKQLSTYNFPHINNECIIGFWVHLNDFKEFELLHFQFFAPEKQDWPIDPKYGEVWYDFKEVSEEIKKLHMRKRSPLIWIKKPNAQFERIMVVWW